MMINRRPRRLQDIWRGRGGSLREHRERTDGQGRRATLTVAARRDFRGRSEDGARGGWPRAPFSLPRPEKPAGRQTRIRSSRYGMICSSEMRVCCIESRSRTVTVPFSIVSPSTVMQKGVPASSWRR